MNFLHQPLTWGFLLVAVPVLIHLINMMRHRRVKWAAMEFLLASYKKHRKWIWLKQLLLLLARMAAIAAIVFILAQWVPPDRWAKLFGGKVTHHYVLLDDSFSMMDRAGEEGAFQQAKDLVNNIVERAAAQETEQKLTLVRYSQAAGAGSPSGEMNIADVAAQNIRDPQWREAFRALQGTMAPSQLSVGPDAAMELLDEILAEDSDESRIVYIVSDFRKRDWDNPATIDQYLHAWEKTGADVHLVDCVTKERPNLAVTHVAPAEGTRSAGVPLFVTVTVKNFGPGTVEDLKLTVTSYAYATFDPTLHGDNPAAIKPESLDQRSETIEKLEAGESISQRIQVRFPTPGKHVVEAKIPDDAVNIDNTRYCVVDFPEGESVLIVDGHERNRHAFYLRSVFQPRSDDLAGEGRGALTGILPAVAKPADLNGMPLETLRRYRAIYLLDVPRLDDAAIRKLEEYVSAGGGLAIFLGGNVNPTHYRETLYNDGEGLMPMPLDKLELLTVGDVENEERVPDFEAVDHPVMEVFNHRETGALFRRGVMIGTYYRTPPGWSPSSGEATEILATLRDEAKTPLVVEKRVGRGRVILMNTTVAPLWNNWKGEASFPATMLLLHGYIAAPLRAAESRLVGAAVDTRWDAQLYHKDAQVIIPEISPISRKPVVVQARPVAEEGAEGDGAEVEVLSVPVGAAGELDTPAIATDRQGIYEVWAAKKAGGLDLEVRRFAFNIDSEEGELARVSSTELAEELTAPFHYHGVGDMQYQSGVESTSHASEILLYVLIALLVGEQLLAYSASYHPAPSRASGSGPAAHGSLRGAAR